MHLWDCCVKHVSLAVLASVLPKCLRQTELPECGYRAKERAKANWQRAQKAAEKSITMNLLKGKRE